MKFEKRHLKECFDIFTESINSGESIFKPLSIEEFEKRLLGAEHNVVAIVKAVEDEVIGFAFGSLAETTGYVSYIGVKSDYRRKGIGTQLYLELEKEMLKENCNVNKIDCIFYNPCTLPWIIPGYAPHDHAGTPGVYMESDSYHFFKSIGFFDYAIQNAYYMPLGNFSEKEKIKEKKEALKKMGIEVCFFNKEKHFGFSELFDNIKNEGWRKSVMPRLDEKIVVAVKDQRIIGYSGPLSVSKDKRGLFCGIGVHTDFRQYGIGSVIFSELCLGLQNMGAEFMSLFTGENNPAKFVYENTGFKLVAKFSCMRKTL